MNAGAHAQKHAVTAAPLFPGSDLRRDLRAGEVVVTVKYSR